MVDSYTIAIMDKDTANMYYNFIINTICAFQVTNFHSITILRDVENAIKVLNKFKYHLTKDQREAFKKIKKSLNDYSSTSHTVSSSSLDINVGGSSR